MPSRSNVIAIRATWSTTPRSDRGSRRWTASWTRSDRQVRLIRPLPCWSRSMTYASYERWGVVAT